MARIIKCACDSNNCPAQLELIPEGTFMRVKSGGVTVALDMRRALELIGVLDSHFYLGVRIRRKPAPVVKQENNHA